MPSRTSTRAREAIDGTVPKESAAAQSLRTLTDEVEALQDQNRDNEVRAPADGTVSHMYLKENQTISAGQTVAQIDDLTRMKMVVVVTPQETASVKIGEPMTVRFRGQLVATTVEAVSDYELAGEVPNLTAR